MMGDFGEAHYLEHRLKDIGHGRGEFNEFEAHQAHRVFVEIGHGLAPALLLKSERHSGSDHDSAGGAQGIPRTLRARKSPKINCRPKLFMGEAAVADQGFDGRESFRDPVTDPRRHVAFVMAHAAQAIEHRDVVQRMDVAPDQGRDLPMPGTRKQASGQQGRFRGKFFEVFDDRHRLNDDCALVEPQRGHPALRVKRQVIGLTMLAPVTDQVDRDRVKSQALKRQSNAHPVGRGRTVIGEKIHGRAWLSRSSPALQPQGGAHQALLLTFDLAQVFTDVLDMRHRRLARLLRQASGHRVVEPRMMAVDLALLGVTVIEVVDRGEHGIEQQVCQRSQGLHQHRVVRGLADGQMKRMVETRVLGCRQRVIVARHQRLVSAGDQHEIGVGAAQCCQARRFAFQQAAHFEQVVEGPRLGGKQTQATHLRNKRALAVAGFDDPSGAQQVQPLAQGRARHAQFFSQPPLGGQQLADLQYPVDDQPLNPLTDHIGHLLRASGCVAFHGDFLG
nr:hypothetical protein [Tanacetum cinerariifolium]